MNGKKPRRGNEGYVILWRKVRWKKGKREEKAMITAAKRERERESGKEKSGGDNGGERAKTKGTDTKRKEEEGHKEGGKKKQGQAGIRERTCMEEKQSRG